MNILIADIETVPDYSRTDLFTPKLDVKVLDMAKDESVSPEDYANAMAKETGRVLSTQAEYCQMVGLNFARDEEDPVSAWVGDVDKNGEEVTERSLLEAFWALAAKAKTIIGYNFLRFDLNVILTRSAFLNVEPTRQYFDAKPWTNEIVDLLKRRFQYAPTADYKTLKELRRVLQLPIPDEYREALMMDGGGVEELYLQWMAGDADALAKLKLYGKLDIVTTRELARFWSGFYFPHLVARR